MARDILFVNRYFAPCPSATSQLLGDLATALAREGRRVTVITSRRIHGDESTLLPRRDAVRGVQVIRVASSALRLRGIAGRVAQYLSFYLAATWTLARILRAARRAGKASTLVTMTDPPLLGVAGVFGCRTATCRHIHWIQDIFPDTAFALGLIKRCGPLGRALRAMQRRTLLRVHAAITIDATMLKTLLRHGLPEARGLVIHNWADGEAIVPLPAQQNHLRREWALANSFVVGYSGNLGRAHDYETILDAATLLRSESIVFLFVGGGEMHARLHRIAHQRGLSNIVTKPFQPREMLASSLGVADVHLVTMKPELEGFVLPSKFYGIAAAGRACIGICDPEGGLARLIRESGAGPVVAVGDATRLAATIREMRNTQSHVAMGLAARATFEAGDSFRRALADWRDALDGAATPDTTRQER